jgi:hypothetical protein
VKLFNIGDRVMVKISCSFTEFAGQIGTVVFAPNDSVCNVRLDNNRYQIFGFSNSLLEPIYESFEIDL